MPTPSSATRLLLMFSTALALSMPQLAVAQDNEYAEALTALGRGQLAEIVANPIVIDAIVAQNAVTASYDQAKIDALDQQWRAEVSASSRPLIDEVMSNPLSQYLDTVQTEAAGLFTEIFVMDAKGLNIGQSTITSDYWQADEAKFQNSYGAGPDGIDLGEVELDESTQTYQSQVSITVVDASGTPIGAITAGVDLSAL
jgi:hypothetical protein